VCARGSDIPVLTLPYLMFSNRGYSESLSASNSRYDTWHVLGLVYTKVECNIFDSYNAELYSIYLANRLIPWGETFMPGSTAIVFAPKRKGIDRQQFLSCILRYGDKCTQHTQTGTFKHPQETFLLLHCSYILVCGEKISLLESIDQLIVCVCVITSSLQAMTVYTPVRCVPKENTNLHENRFLRSKMLESMGLMEVPTTTNTTTSCSKDRFSSNISKTPLSPTSVAAMSKRPHHRRQNARLLGTSDLLAIRVVAARPNLSASSVATAQQWKEATKFDATTPMQGETPSTPPTAASTTSTDTNDLCCCSIPTVSPPPAAPRVQFQSHVSAVAIPCRCDYTTEEKQLLWSDRLTIHDMAHRNTVEFAYEANDWQHVLEEEDFVRIQGRLVHPVHIPECLCHVYTTNTTTNIPRRMTTPMVEDG
jgi:hypothetical protein